MISTPVRLDPLETDLVGAFLDQPSLFASPPGEKVPGLLTSADLRAIFAATPRFVGSRGVDASALLAEFVESAARGWLENRLAVHTFQDEASARDFLDKTLPVLFRRMAKKERTELKRSVLEAGRAGDQDRVNELMRRIDELDQRAKRGGTEG